MVYYVLGLGKKREGECQYPGKGKDSPFPPPGDGGLGQRFASSPPLSWLLSILHIHFFRSEKKTLEEVVGTEMEQLQKMLEAVNKPEGIAIF